MSAADQLRAVIVATMKGQGVKQVDLAERIGHTQKHVSQALNGRCGLSLDLAEKMLTALGMDLVVAILPSSARDCEGCRFDRRVTRTGD